MEAPAGLIVFAKPPRPGRVKTRLTPPLDPRQAARLYEAFVRDALRAYGRLDVDVLLYVAVSEDDPDPATIEVFRTADRIYVQQGRGLGERMAHAFARSFREGYGRLVVIGTDHPTLPPAFIERAFDELRQPSTVVIGPSEDGGYYLLGMNDFYPRLWTGMSYSHSQVFEQTLERAAGTGAGLVLLPDWYDVDDADDLRRLEAELRDGGNACRATRQVLKDLRRS